MKLIASICHPRVGGDLLAFLFIVFLSACTDYVNQIEDERDEWRSAREQAALLSSGDIEEVSSSSSSVVLSSGNHDNLTSSSVESSSSSVNSKTSSSSVVSSSDGGKESSSSSSVILSGDSREESSSSAVKSCSSERIESSSSEKDDNSSSSSVIVVSSSSSNNVSSSSSAKTNSSSSSKKDESSSSSKKVESSSSEKSSWAYLNPAISYGEMTDNHDGQVYKTVKIGEQTWMAENLNLETVDSYCFNDLAMYCDKYGRLYTWTAAIEACPAGWHLPDSTECEKLFAAVGGINDAGIALKSTIDWMSSTYYSGKDIYGFSAHSAGYKNKEGEYGGLGEWANFWLFSEYDSEKARLMFFNYDVGSGLLGYTYKNELYSVRCLKNEIPQSSSSISSSSSSKALWMYLNPAISYGEMTDDRDGQVYKTVEIGEQTWMAENLNYEIEPYKVNYEEVRSFCYNDSVKYCEKYGRLYTWQAANRACPTNWRLPTNAEFHALVDATGGMSIAGKKLRAFGANSGCEGTNDYGFSGLPSGMWDDYDGYYAGEGTSAYFWSSTEFYTDFELRGAYYMMLWNANNYVYLDDTGDSNRRNFYTNYGYSVRCIKK